jgi:hypothetical protein
LLNTVRQKFSKSSRPGFSFLADGYEALMLDTKSIPQPGERWLSCPPYMLIAHILRVEPGERSPLVSYELQDDDGAAIETVDHAVLDDDWWRAFQPMRRRFG